MVSVSETYLVIKLTKLSLCLPFSLFLTRLIPSYWELIWKEINKWLGVSAFNSVSLLCSTQWC